MTLPMFIDEDAHYEYERERYEDNYGYRDGEEKREVQFDGFKDSE